MSLQGNFDALDCGIHGARRIYCFLKLGYIPDPSKIDTEVSTTQAFRLTILESLLKHSQYVSTYVSPTGSGNIFLTEEKKIITVASPIKKNCSKILPKKNSKAIIFKNDRQ